MPVGIYARRLKPPTSHTCRRCGAEFFSGYGYRQRRNLRNRQWKYCSLRCANMKASRATIRPSTHDIAWAAGVYEGEGSCANNRGSGGCTISQKDLWLLERFRALFGGTIRTKADGTSTWEATGPRARGFLITMYHFLSPRRKEQVLKALGMGVS